MSIVAKLVAAKQEMPQLVADETVRTKTYSFKYASLQAILKVVTPALHKQGIILVQDVGMHDDIFGVKTKLLCDDDNTYIASGIMPIEISGDSRDLSGRITTARRLQLQSLLGLAADDEPNVPQPTRQAPPVQAHKQQDYPLERLQRAARAGEAPGRRSEELESLMDAITMHDSDEAADIPITVREGDSQSAYTFFINLFVGKELTLSYLFGRVITPGTPPKVTHRFLVEEIKQGKWTTAITEAANLAEQA